MVKRLLLACALLCLTACEDPEVTARKAAQAQKALAETVMLPNSELKAYEGDVSLTITSGENIERNYAWENCTLASDMEPRTYRWFGKKGLYDPAASFISESGCNGIYRTVVEEGQIHFPDMASAIKWQTTHMSKMKPLFSRATTGDGLVLVWGITPGRHQLHADLWQICVAGKPPAGMPVIENSHIEITGRVPCVSVSDAVYTLTQKEWTDFWWENQEFSRCTKLKPQSEEVRECFAKHKAEVSFRTEEINKLRKAETLD